MVKKILIHSDNLLSKIPTNSLFFLKKAYEINDIYDLEEAVNYDKNTIIVSLKRLEKILKEKLISIQKNKIILTEIAKKICEEIAYTDIIFYNNRFVFFIDNRLYFNDNIISKLIDIVKNYKLIFNFYNKDFITNNLINSDISILLMEDQVELKKLIKYVKKNDLFITKIFDIRILEVFKENKEIILKSYPKANLIIQEKIKEKFDDNIINESRFAIDNDLLRMQFVKNNLGKSLFIDKNISKYEDLNSEYKNENLEVYLISNRKKLLDKIKLVFESSNYK